MLNNTYPFELPKLPYSYDALEPYIDEETMHYHYDKHFKTYIDNLNKALKPYPYLHKMSLVQLLKSPEILPGDAYISIMNNGGGVYNHYLFFNRLAPAIEDRHMPHGSLLSLVNQSFGSFSNLKTQFSMQAMNVFGSGWTYLVLSPENNLQIINLKNQETPVMLDVIPIILFDVWEHAYYLKYKNRRVDYVTGLWNVITFPESR